MSDELDHPKVASAAPSGGPVAEASPRKLSRRLLICVAIFIGAMILLIAAEWGALSGLRSSSAPASPSTPSANIPGGAAGPSDALGGAAGPSAASLPVLETASAPAVPTNQGTTGGPTAVRAFAASPLPPPPPQGDRSPLANHLNDPARTARDDVIAIAEILANYREAMDTLPVGTNAEITAALAGDNPRAHTPLPADSPAISPGGELLDRWGTPYFFHQISRELTEIRSAGPDQRQFTADDIVWPENASAGSPSLAQSTP